MSSNIGRKWRVGDLSYGSAGVEAHLNSNLASFTVSASQLGLSKVEAVLSAQVTTQTVAAAVSVSAALAGTSTVVGLTVIQAAGTTVNLILSVLGT